MSIFTKATAYVAHKSAKVVKGSGGAIKNFVSDVKDDMKTFEKIDNLKAQDAEDLKERMEFIHRNQVIDGDIAE